MRFSTRRVLALTAFFAVVAAAIGGKLGTGHIGIWLGPPTLLGSGLFTWLILFGQRAHWCVTGLTVAGLVLGMLLFESPLAGALCGLMGGMLFIGTASDTNVTDAGIRDLSGLENLVSLDLTGSPVSDDVVRALGSFPHLRIVSLAGTQITDDGIRGLAQLPTLYQATVPQSGISPEAIAELRKSVKIVLQHD